MLLSTMAILTACPDPTPTPDPDAPKQYTYNAYLSVFPTTWNSHTYQTTTDGEILGYTENGFYTFDYNEDRTGFVVVPDMATGMPVDVSSEYVGEDWNIAEGETARAWRINFRNDIKWEDGTPITSKDFVESAELLLDPKAINYRADSLYAGNMAIMNAKAFFYGGRFVEKSTPMIDYGYLTIDELTEGEDGQLESEEGVLYFDYKDGCQWSSNSLYDYYEAGYLHDVVSVPAVDEDGNPVIGKDGKPVMTTELVAGDAVNAFKAIMAKADPESDNPTLVKVDKEVAENLILCIAVLQGFSTPEEYSAALESAGRDGTYAYTEWNEFCYVGEVWDVIDFDKVGIKAHGDYAVDIILESALEGFYLNYNLTGNLGLVNVDLYKSLRSVDANGIYTNTYGTTAETYMSYGPYKLTSFQTDKQFVLERNDNWYGYNDHEAGPGWYQTSRIVYDWINDNDTAFQKFLKGELTSKGLDATTIEEYSGSDRLYYTDGSSTFFIALNPDEGVYAAWDKDPANAGFNKSVLTVKEFRMALSFALDRKAFCLACDPTGSTGFAVFNNMICSDPDNGTMYRETEQAKDVLLKFWGIDQKDIGEGKLFTDKDDAIASITGYNLEEAKNLFNTAYDKAVEAGIYNGTDKVKIVVGIPGTHSFYTLGYEFLKNCYTEAVEGTKFEGKLEFTTDDTIGNKFADSLRSNQTDLLFGVGWNGSALNPYGLIGAYTDPQYQYDPAWNTSAQNIDIEIGGVTYRGSVMDWTDSLEGQKVEFEVIVDGQPNGETKTISLGTYADMDDRLLALAALEGAVLDTYDMIPVNNDSSASLLGFKVNYGNEEYVYGVGRGGIKYMTYNYDDVEWAAFVASQGGTLNYK